MNPWKWFQKKSLLEKAQVILIIIFGSILVIELALFGWTWVTSLQGGLALHAEPWHDRVSITQGTTAEIGFTFGLQNAPFCSAVCEWGLIDHRTGETLVNGTAGDPPRDGIPISTTITVEDTGRTSGLFQFIATCKNRETLRCQRPGQEARIAASTRIDVTYSDAKEASITALLSEKTAWEETVTELLARTIGVARVTDPRATTIARDALNDGAAFHEELREVQRLVEEEAFSEALRLMNTTRTPDALTRYEALVREERAARDAIERIDREALRMFPLIADPTRHARLSLATQTLITNPFNTTQPTILRSAAQNISKTLTMIEEANTDYPNIAAQLASSAKNSTIITCALYEEGCGYAKGDTNTLAQAVQTALDACSAIRGVAGARAAWTLREHNLTLVAAEQFFNVSAIRNATWPAREEEIIARAKTGNVSGVTAAERVAVQVEASDTSECPDEGLSLPSIPAMPNPSLPEAPRETIKPFKIILPEEQCCTNGRCITCGEEQSIPVLFVHGHSFAEGSTPEWNLQAFTKMAVQLEEEGILYAGSVFPTTSDVVTVYEDLPGSVSLTTTYYYDSFAEEGTLQLVPRKSERIETYAIRLAEAVNAARRATGSEKVIIVAHSMGGLVTRRYAQLFGTEALAGAVLIGTPNHGIPLRTERLCPVVGADNECQDMTVGSVFLKKVNTGPPLDIPILTIAGTGCDGKAFDGVVDTESVALEGAENHVEEGTCPSNDELLHNTLIDPESHPAVYEQVKAFIESFHP